MLLFSGSMHACVSDHTVIDSSVELSTISSEDDTTAVEHSCCKKGGEEESDDPSCCDNGNCQCCIVLYTFSEAPTNTLKSLIFFKSKFTVNSFVDSSFSSDIFQPPKAA
jgi:hypothetical protein